MGEAQAPLAVLGAGMDIGGAFMEASAIRSESKYRQMLSEMNAIHSEMRAGQELERGQQAVALQRQQI